MTERPKTGLRLKLVNFFGALGYVSCVFQWLWTALLYFSLINTVVLFISPSADKPAPTPVPPVTPSVDSSPLSVILAAVIVIIMIAFTVYIIYKMPSTLAKTSKKIVHNAAESVTPVVLRAQHKKDTKKIHIKITSAIIIFIKLLIIFIPIALAFGSVLLEKHMIDYQIAIYVSLWLVSPSLLFFGLQYSLAQILSLKRQDLW